MIKRIKKYFFWVVDKLAAHWLIYLLGSSGATAFLIVFWKWLKAKHSLEMDGWLWLTLSVIFVFLLIFCLYTIVMEIMRCNKFRRKLTKRKDVEMAIKNWIEDLKPKRECYYYRDIEKELKLKRRRLKAYIESVAAECGVTVEMGQKTFTLTKEDIQVV